MSDASFFHFRANLLLQSITDYAIFMLDPQGIVSSWNPGAERLKQYRAEEIIGQHFSRFYTAEDKARQIPAAALRIALEEGRFEAEGWRVRKDGVRFWANVVIDPVRDNDGRHIGFAKITRDLTERKLAQEALEKSQAQLFQLQKMEAIGQLTGGVAHDFNNILAAILGSLRLARRRMAEGQDTSQFIDNAVQAAERGAMLTQRMLAFARRQELKLEPVDVVVCVRDMAEMLERTIGPGIRISLRFPLKLPPVLGDRSQLELALMNLVVNARDAMPDGGTITIEAERCRVSGKETAEHVCLAVRDEGEGMDERTLSRAAEPFFTTKGIGKGTGLGLSMVQGMVEQCGGEFRLESVQGHGTTAEIRLPVAEIPEEQPEAAPERLLESGAPQKILAVDDDAIVLLNTVTMLEDLGHEVMQASSGRAALRILAETPIDLLVSDYAMPGMTGGELVEEARKIQPELKVIILSGYADLPEGIALDVPRLGKPFTDAELTEIVATAGR